MEANERTNLKKHVIDEILKTDTNGSSILKDTIIEQVNEYAKAENKIDKQKYAIYLQALSKDPYDYIKINYKDNNVKKEIKIDEYFVKESEKSINEKMSLVAKEIRDRQYNSSSMEAIGIVPYFSSVYGSWWFKDYLDENQVMNMIDTPDYVYMDYAQSNKNSIYYVEKWDASSPSIDKNKSNATMGLLQTDGNNKWLVIDNFIGMSSPGKQNDTEYEHEITKNSIVNYDYFITYNDLPLYRLNEDIIFNNDSIVNFNNLNLADLFTKIFNDNKNILASYEINTNSNNHLQLLDELFINVSSELKFDTNFSQTYFENYKFIKNELFQDRNMTIINKDKLLIPSDRSDSTIAYLPQNSTYDQLVHGPKNIVDIYNNSLEHVQSSSSLGNELILKTRKVNQETLQEAVVLYEKVSNQQTYSFQKLEYAETPEGATNFNLSLSNTENESVIATTGKEMNNIKARLSVFSTPAKIYFVYSNSNLVNVPGSSSLNQSIIPDYIDSPELVLENAKHTYYLPPNNNYVMYQENPTHEIVLKNSLFNLFSIALNNQVYYFDSANQAQNELINYIKMNAFLAL